MDTATQAWLDQNDALMADIIRRCGWSIQYVGGAICDAPGCECADEAGPAFAYTVGLFGLGHPELLIVGVEPDLAQTILNELGNRVKAGATIVPGQLITVESPPLRIVPEVVPDPGEIVFMANRFYRRPDEASVPVLQLSYNDANQRLP